MMSGIEMVGGSCFFVDRAGRAGRADAAAAGRGARGDVALRLNLIFSGLKSNGTTPIGQRGRCRGSMAGMSAPSALADADRGAPATAPTAPRHCRRRQPPTLPPILTH